jgi:ribosomal protein L11 methyltransferase
MSAVIFYLPQQEDLDEVWHLLENAGCQLLYSVEEEGVQQITGYLPPNFSVEMALASFPFINSIQVSPLPDIDWTAQWSAHGLDYREGYVHVNLRDYFPDLLQTSWKPELKLKPGPGFGDLSHPTTRLILKLMGPYVFQQNVLDVGSGSGILSFAAIVMNAKNVCGIDIDELAIEHSNENAKLNDMESHLLFTTPDKYLKQPPSAPLTLLMNMIQSEQCQAMETLKSIHPQIEYAVTSGILAGDQHNYLKQCQQWGWHMLKSQEEDGWTGYLFQNKKQCPP